MTDYFLSEIYIYPIKSLSGIQLREAEIQPGGLKYDRRWMLVDHQGIFLTQRKYPQMSLISVEINNNEVVLTHKQNNSSVIKFPIDAEDKVVDVIIWNDYVKAKTVGTSVDEWLSSNLKIKCRLIHQDPYYKREINNEFVSGKEVSFADAYPYLIIGQPSLDDLNNRLAEPLPMNRFRPNFVFTGGKSYDEDKWSKFLIGDKLFRSVKPCSRCSITTINQDTAERSDEPLRTLASYRQIDNKVYFGHNLVCESDGMVKCGERIEVVERKLNDWVID